MMGQISFSYDSEFYDGRDCCFLASYGGTRVSISLIIFKACQVSEYTTIWACMV